MTLTDQGWVECLQCEDLMGCGQCLDGLAPPGEMVDAALVGHHPTMPITDLKRKRMRRALVAAARWEREQ